jgi:hypothetical protein
LAAPLVRLHGQPEPLRSELFSRQIAILGSHLLATVPDRHAFHRWLTIPGLGQSLALSIIYESAPLHAFRRLVSVPLTAAWFLGAHSGPVNRRGLHAKPGSSHLTWATGQAALYAGRYDPKNRRCFERHRGRHRGKGGKRIADAISAH